MLGQSEKERDLLRHLAETLVEDEVMKPMEQIGWGHGTPPPPGSGTTPPTEGAPAETPATGAAPAADGPPAPTASASPATEPAKANAPMDLLAQMESLRDPETGLILKKYKDATEAIKGVGHAVQMAKTAFSQRDAALAEAERLRKETAARLQPAETPSAAQTPASSTSASQQAVEAARDRLDKVLTSVVEDGGVFDEVSAKEYSLAQRELARAEARLAAEETTSQRDAAAEAERAKWNAVDEYMGTHHPGSLDKSDEVGLFVQSDPLLQEAIAALVSQGKEIKASELAWNAYKRAYPDTPQPDPAREAAETKEVELSAKEQVRREAVEAARKDAGIIGGSSAGQGVHEAPGIHSSQEEIERWGIAMRRSGTGPGTPAAQQFRKLVIGPSLDPAVFGE